MVSSIKLEKVPITWDLTRIVTWLHGFLVVSQDGLVVLAKIKRLISKNQRTHPLEFLIVSLVVRVSSALMALLAWYVSFSSVFSFSDCYDFESVSIWVPSYSIYTMVLYCMHVTKEGYYVKLVGLQIGNVVSSWRNCCI